MDRRRLLQSVPSFLVASSVPALWTPAQAAKVQFPAALLVPKTGQHAALGRSMERAAQLAQGETDRKALQVYDTGGTPEGAAAATRLARKGGATVILGPVFAAEVPAVLAAAGTVPVVTFSNDQALLERGAFLFGITARQVVGDILRYAAQRGIRNVAVGGSDQGWGAQARAAAVATGEGLGIKIVALPAGPITIVAPASDVAGDGLPDAVLMTDIDGLLAIAPAAAAQGMQVLGATQALDIAPDSYARLDGAWLAAPDPARFAGFARAFEQRNGSRPGAIAGLAYDAVTIARQMRLGGGTDRSALLNASGFKAICGDVRFRDDGSAARALAILAIAGGRLRTVATPALA
jgi:ABC-type branched-subunit amino acid transport system substrate-binding protein